MDALEHIIRATWKCQLLLLITTRVLFKQKKMGKTIQHSHRNNFFLQISSDLA